MTVKSESYAIDTSERDFIQIHLVQVWENGSDMGGTLWFERSSLRWVAETLHASVTTHAFPRTTAIVGDDRLGVHETGAEQAPFIHLVNERPAGSPHGGKYRLAFSKGVAARLAAELATHVR